MMKKRLLGLTAAIAVTATMFAAPASAGPNARVNVVHGIPGVPVNVCVNGGTLAEDFRFGNKIVGAALAPGEYRVKLVAAGKPCSAPAILRSTYTLAAGTNVTIVAALNASGTPKLKAFANGVKKLATGQARLTVRHTAQAPAVNVWANGSPLIDGTDFTWGANATVTVCHTGTPKADLPRFTRDADILVVAAGSPESVTGDMIKPGAVVIDVGVNRVDDPTTEKGYRLTGDVHFASAKEVAGAITPVPGGVGPMTIAMLMTNTVQAARQSA